MARYHVGSDGSPRPCTATVRACPLGEEAHYPSQEAALEAIRSEAGGSFSSKTRATPPRGAIWQGAASQVEVLALGGGVAGGSFSESQVSGLGFRVSQGEKVGLTPQEALKLSPARKSAGKPTLLALESALSRTPLRATGPQALQLAFG